MSDHKHTKIIRQTVTLSFILNGDGTGDEKGVDRQMNVLADVEEVIVRQISTTGIAGQDNTLITCDAFGDRSFIGSFSGRDFTDVSPNSTFMVKGPLKSAKFGFVRYG